MELTLPRRVVAALAAGGFALSVLAGITGAGHVAARSAAAGTSTDADLITEVAFPALLAGTATHDHGPENLQTK